MSAATLAFFSDPHVLLGDASRRPRSLMTDAALQLLGLTVHLPDHTLSLDEERIQIACYDYLHSQPIADVKWMVTRMNWRDLMSEISVSDETIALFRCMRDEYHAMIQASSYRIRLKQEEKEANDKAPADLAYPSLLAIRLRRIAEETGWTQEYIGWHLPLPEALQHLWASQLAAGRWTIAPQDPDEETPDDIRPEWMIDADPLTPAA
jgi:hypothetical protein